MGEGVQGIAVARGEAGAGKGAAAAEQMEHGAAAVDGEGGKGGVDAEEIGEEAAVAIAEHQGAATGGERGQMGEAGAGERAAEGEVLKQAVGAGDAVEGGGWHQRQIP